MWFCAVWRGVICQSCSISPLLLNGAVDRWKDGTWTIHDASGKKKKKKQTIQAAQSKLYLIVFFPPPKDWCHPNVCTVSPVKARPWTALACFSSSQWLPLSLRCEGCKLWPTVRQAVTFTDQNNLTSHSRAWGSLFFFFYCYYYFFFFFLSVVEQSTAPCSVSVKDKRHESSVCACSYVKPMSAQLKDAMS